MNFPGYDDDDVNVSLVSAHYWRRIVTIPLRHSVCRACACACACVCGVCGVCVCVCVCVCGGVVRAFHPSIV